MVERSKSAREFLEQELDRRIQANPAYSLRALARQFKMQPGELSEILRGKRSLSTRSALKIASALGLSAGETQRLLLLAQADHGERKGIASESLERTRALAQAPSEDPTHELSAEVFRVVAEWFHFAILNLVETRGFKEDPRWIARRLGISTFEAQQALQRLEKVGLLERGIPARGAPRGALKPCRDWIVSPSGIPSEAIKSAHRTLLQKAITALDAQSIDERDYAGLTFVLDPARVGELRQELARAIEPVLERFRTVPAASTVSASRASHKITPTEIYHLETALFRLTTPENSA